jgi:hypothetical protein
MVTSSLINRLSQAIDQIERRTQQKPWKVVRVRRGWQEHGDVAIDRHLAAHPEDRDSDVAIFHFCDDPLADEGQVAAATASASKDLKS